MNKHLGAAFCCALWLAGAGRAAAQPQPSAGLQLLDRLITEQIVDGAATSLPVHTLATPPETCEATPPQCDTAQSAELIQQLDEALRQNALLAQRIEQLQAQPASHADGAAVGTAAVDTAAVGTAAAELATLRAQVASLADSERAHQQKSAALAAERDRAAAELAALKGRLADPQAEATPKAATAGPAFVMGKGASQDVKASYAVGAWYGDSVPQETEKFRSVGMKLDVRAFTQGFHDKIHNRLQLAQDAIAAELARIDQSLGKAMLSKNQKESAGLLEKAAKEKGAVKTSEGAVYRVIDPGKPPTAHARSQVLFELTEALGTGEVLADAEKASSAVGDLPPLFQAIVKKLGVGGSARVHIPGDQVYGQDGVPGVVPPGAVVVMTIKVLDIKSP